MGMSGMFAQNFRRLWIVVLIAGLLAACGHDNGPPASIAGLAVTHFESGLRINAPKPSIPVRNGTDEAT